MMVSWALAITAARGETLLLVPGLFTPDFGGCDPYTSFQPGVTGVAAFWVVVHANGPAAAGFSQFEGYIEGLEGLPPFWQVQVDPVSPGVMTGNFVAPRWVGLPNAVERGGIVTYPQCQNAKLVPILQVVLLAVGATENVARNTVIRVKSTYPAVSPELACPVLTICDSTAFTKVCVAAEGMVINSDPPLCPELAVAPSSWGQVKALFH